jgi:PPOX class probable F420-dependent enzyme
LPRTSSPYYRGGMNRRNQIALTPDEAQRYLTDAHTIILATNDKRGYPHLVAMWYAVEPDGTVVMTTFGKSQKVLNLRRDPRCTLLVESGRSYDQLQGLMLRCHATIDGDTEHVLDTLELVHKKYGMPGEGKALREALTQQARKRVVIKITPEKAASWDHRKLAGAY